MADSSGRIKPSKRDKYIQINELLKITEKLIPNLLAQKSDESHKSIKIVDLASGSATLTFAVHYFLTQHLASENFEIVTVGIERQMELVEKSRALAEQLRLKLDLHGITFEVGEIASADQQGVDLTLALHACDLATDDAIDFVIANGAKAALIIPCCHQSRPDEAKQLPAGLEFIARDGILRERFADLITDGLRAEKLRVAGYKSEVMEFVGDEHTARNLLIKAVRVKGAGEQ
jgi:hypothetical protein